VIERKPFRSWTAQALTACAIVALLLLAGPFAANAASSLKVTGSATCSGKIGGATDDPDTADFPPDSNFALDFGFFTGAPSKKGAVAGAFVMTMDKECLGFLASSSQVPCVQAGAFTGTVAKVATAGTSKAPPSPGQMTLLFSDLPGALSAPDVLDGCQLTFDVVPFASAASSYFVAASLITQVPTQRGKPAPPPCVPSRTRILMGCTSSKN
jgi:hypothetical protein